MNSWTFCIVAGNVFVIAAIILERNLQNVANYLVASLAVADLMVACLVMPLGAVYEVSRLWYICWRGRERIALTKDTKQHGRMLSRIHEMSSKLEQIFT